MKILGEIHILCVRMRARVITHVYVYACARVCAHIRTVYLCALYYYYYIFIIYIYSTVQLCYKHVANCTNSTDIGKKLEATFFACENKNMQHKEIVRNKYMK